MTKDKVRNILKAIDRYLLKWHYIADVEYWAEKDRRFYNKIYWNLVDGFNALTLERTK